MAAQSAKHSGGPKFFDYLYFLLFCTLRLFLACTAGGSCERDLSAPAVAKGEWDEWVKDSCLVASGEAAFVARSGKKSQERLLRRLGCFQSSCFAGGSV